MFALPGSTCNGRGQGGMHHQCSLRIRRQRTYMAQALTRHVGQRSRRMTIRIVRKGIALSMAFWVVMATSWALPGQTEAWQVRNNLVPAAYAQTAANTLDRTILPPTAPQCGGTIGNTYKNSVPDRLRSADRPESVYTGESRV